MSGSGISWAIRKSAPCSRQITTPAPHHSVFYRPDALPVAQPTASKQRRQINRHECIMSTASIKITLHESTARIAHLHWFVFRFDSLSANDYLRSLFNYFRFILFYKFTNLQLLNVSPVFIGPPCGHCIKHIALFENFLYNAVHAWDRCRMNGQAMQYSSLNKTVGALSIEALT